MWHRKVAVCALAAAVAAFAGACSDQSLTTPLAFDQEVQLFSAPADPGADALVGLDAHLARIAEAVPGYGGHFYDETGTLNVYIAAAQARAAAALPEALRGELAALGINVDAQPVRILTAQYDFAQLARLHRQVGPVLSLGGVVYTDADEASNRVVIGVEHGAATAVEQALSMLGIPAEAVVIRETEPIYPMQTLRDRRRPIGGGLQINFPGFLCTLGFNVRSPSAPAVHGFVTNSHCTNQQFVTGNTPYWQPSSGVPDSFIGNEAHDAPGFTGGACPAGRVCRNSDAAGVRYAAGVENFHGQVMRTQSRNSLVIDLIFPTWFIASEHPGNGTIGEEIHKTGRTTGWTWGNISSTCANTNVGGTNFTLFCQDIVTGPTNTVAGGDSGSPTFRRTFGGPFEREVELRGILWGGSGSTIFVYSPMQRVRMDNPPPPGVANWTTFPGQTPP